MVVIVLAIIIVYFCFLFFYYGTSDLNHDNLPEVAFKQSDEQRRLYSKLSDLDRKVSEQSDLLQQLKISLQNGDKSVSQDDMEELKRQIYSGKETIKNLQKLIQEKDDQLRNKKPGDSEPVSMKRIFVSLPPTSIWCYGDNRRDRMCKFKNLYYDPNHSSWFAVINENSIIHNVPVDRSPALLDLTSLDDHSVFYFDYDEVVDDVFKNVMVNVIQKRSYVFSRFHIGNIMHTMHDDILGLYHTIRRFGPVDTSNSKPDFAALDLDNVLQLYDDHSEGPYGHVFKLFSKNPVRFKEDLFKDKGVITMFEDVIVGNSKQANWYQYGFASPQGPIPDKHVYGYHIRQVADFITWQLGLHDSQLYEFVQDKKPPNKLAVFSRKDNRLIVNEQEVLDRLAKEFKLEPIFLRMEDQSYKEQVAILKQTKVVVSMHGSMLIMTMFLPPGSVVIEMYPFAVPGDNYSPYKTLAGLPGMNLEYRKWENKHEDRNVMHPEYSVFQGGLKDRSEEERKKIIDTKTVPLHTCCMDPYWLFRIYQDTIVTIPEVTSLVSDSLSASSKKSLDKVRAVPVLAPAKIDAKEVKCTAVIVGEKVKSVDLSWNPPWNGVKPDKYSIWEHNQYKEFFSEDTKFSLDGSRYTVGQKLEIWIRTVKNEVKGKYSDKVECTLK